MESIKNFREFNERLWKSVLPERNIINAVIGKAIMVNAPDISDAANPIKIDAPIPKWEQIKFDSISATIF